MKCGVINVQHANGSLRSLLGSALVSTFTDRLPDNFSVCRMLMERALDKGLIADRTDFNSGHLKLLSFGQDCSRIRSKFFPLGLGKSRIQGIGPNRPALEVQGESIHPAWEANP